MTKKDLSGKVEFNTDKLFNHQKRIVQLEIRTEKLEKKLENFIECDFANLLSEINTLRKGEAQPKHSEFKIGDKVRQKNKELAFFNKVGTICGIRDRYSVCFQQDKGDSVAYFSEEDLELCVEPHHEFKVGDRVQFKSWEEMEKEFGLDEIGDIRTSTCFSRYMKHLCGTYATITEIGEKFVSLKDFTTNGDIYWNYSLDMLKPATDEPKCKFKVGDKVKDIKTGKICIVEKTDDAFFDCMISYNDFKIWRNSERDLEPYPEPRWTFTDDEKVILRNVPEECKWIARDSNENLYGYLKDKPEKQDLEWDNVNGFYSLLIFNHLFQSIKWTDKEPCEFRKYL